MGNIPMFRNDASEFVYVRTYSRWIPELGRRETWPETVDRYINFISGKLGNKIPAKVLRKIKEKVLKFEVMPSMRFLWAAGEPAAQSNVTIYNCAFSAVDMPDAFAEALYVLMCGTGYGFSVEQRHVSKLPTVANEILTSGLIHVVADSKAGWADSIKAQINSLYSGQDIGFDYNGVRPSGARLKTMGGRASGPGPLAQLHSFTREVFYAARGRQLTSLECHDIMNEIATIVVVGGVRRSSEISLSDLNDPLMRDSKTGIFPVRRYMANNSAVYHKKPDIITFMKEWTALAASGSGERGIVNMEAAIKMAPKRRKAEQIQGVNPCVIGSTEILTKDGYQRIEDVVDQETEIWNGFEWSKVTPMITGKNQDTLTVSFNDGRSLTCTPYHKFHVAVGYTGESKIVEAKDLEIGMKLIKHNFPVIEFNKELEDAYTQGFVSAEGMELNRTVYVYKPKEMCLERIQNKKIVKWEENNNRYRIILKNMPVSKSFIPFEYSVKSKLEWLSGLFDGDGCELKEGGLQLASVNFRFLSDLQSMLTTLGIQSKIVPGNKAGTRLMPNHKGGMDLFYCQECKRICIGSTQMQILKAMGLSCERMLFNKKPNRDASLFVAITDVTESEVADKVYCFNEPIRHLGIFNGIVTGNCGEILLRNREFCNLSEVVAREDDDIGTMLEKVECATWMGIIQSCFTDFPYLNEEWKRNCDEERLLGVSITGQLDAPHLCTEEAFKAYKNKAIKVAKKASEVMNIPMPAAITCVKPSGTVSQLVDASSGLHPRFSKYYIRRYRISASDPLFKMIKDQGLPVSPENGQRKTDYVKAIKIFDKTIEEEKTKEEAIRNSKVIYPRFTEEGWNESQVDTWVVSFPTAAPKKSLTVSDFTAIQQLEYYKKVQKNWCEHNASITVYVKPEEWLLVGGWVFENWSIVNGVSFLPFSEHIYEQAPYQEITKDEYESLSKAFPKIDYSQLSRYEKDDNTEGSKSLACSGGNCDI